MAQVLLLCICTGIVANHTKRNYCIIGSHIQVNVGLLEFHWHLMKGLEASCLLGREREAMRWFNVHNRPTDLVVGQNGAAPEAIENERPLTHDLSPLSSPRRPWSMQNQWQSAKTRTETLCRGDLCRSVTQICQHARIDNTCPLHTQQSSL